jgi:hypothetical protein
MSSSRRGGSGIRGERGKDRHDEPFRLRFDELVSSVCAKPQPRLPPTVCGEAPKPGSSLIRPRGSTGNGGLTTLTPTIVSYQQLAARNKQSEIWRHGFAALLTVLASGTRSPPFSLADIDVWATYLARYDIEDLKAAIDKFLTDGDNFPTVVKINRLAKSERCTRLGIALR